ncbi:MAG TPA: nuclear transport factor 2 family protein [Solirubrobacteraceae bacterium]|jgi:hypothetical protein
MRPDEERTQAERRGGAGDEDETRIRRALEAYFSGINKERYGDVASLFAEHGELVAPGIDPRVGPAAIESYFAAALRLYPNHLDQPTRVIVAGRTATVEIHFTGALASGAPIEFDAVDVFDFDAAGEIVRLSSWYDSHAVRAMLKAARDQSPR